VKAQRKLNATYKMESNDDILTIRHIPWGVHTTPIVKNICALNSVLFAFYTLEQNNVLFTKVKDTFTATIHELIDYCHFDHDRHLVYSSGYHVWDDKSQHLQYLEGKTSNAYGILARYHQFYQPSHIGRQVKTTCSTCEKRQTHFDQKDVLDIGCFVSDSNKLSTQVINALTMDEIQPCRLVVPSSDLVHLDGTKNVDDSNVWLYTNGDIERAKNHTLCTIGGPAKCNGSMVSEHEITHVPRLLVAKQGFVKSGHGLKFVNLNHNDLKINGYKGVL